MTFRPLLRYGILKIGLWITPSFMEILLNFFIAVVSGLVVVGGWLLVLGRKFQTLDDVKKKITNLEAVDRKLDILDHVKNKVDSIEKFSQSAANAIVEIQTHLGSRGYNINQKLAITSASPTRLTDYGDQLMEESGFRKIMGEHRRFLIDLVKGKNPNTNYDIQEYSLQVLKDIIASNNEIFYPLKNYAYQKGLLLDIILQAAAIVLRDAVMEEVKFDDHTLEPASG